MNTLENFEYLSNRVSEFDNIDRKVFKLVVDDILSVIADKIGREKLESMSNEEVSRVIVNASKALESLEWNDIISDSIYYE